MNDTVFKPSSLLGTTEAELEENSVQAAAPIERTHNPNDAGAPLKITGEQTIRTADELHETLAQYLDRDLDVVVDLSEVNECDTAALQLIYALRQSAVQRRQRFQIKAVSPAIAETAAALGLQLEDLTIAGGPAEADGGCEVALKHHGI